MRREEGKRAKQDLIDEIELVPVSRQWHRLSLDDAQRGPRRRSVLRIFVRMPPPAISPRILTRDPAAVSASNTHSTVVTLAALWAGLSCAMDGDERRALLMWATHNATPPRTPD